MGIDTLEGALGLEDADARLEALTGLASGTSDRGADAVTAALVEALEAGHGSAKVRLALGEALGRRGDPRVLAPDDAGYYVDVAFEHGGVRIAKFPVTNQEYRAWVEAGGYDDSSAWSDEGRAWLAGVSDPWPVLAQGEEAGAFIVPNQPVVGVTWFEADAYARAMGARLVRADERVRVTRGAQRRPYPWGAPFGEGNSNTREEALGRPCAVGLFVRDATPEGVCDLAGNVAEWHGDAPVVGEERLVHPGSWDQPSLAAWAKALTFELPASRRSALGFRLARDLDA